MVNTTENDVIVAEKTVAVPRVSNIVRYNESQFRLMCKEMLNKHFKNGTHENLVQTGIAIAFDRLSMMFGIDSVVVVTKKKCKKVAVNFLVNSRPENITFEPTCNNEHRYHF
jgi:hypothetical protein